MITTLHFHLQPQYKYELSHINFTINEFILRFRKLLKCDWLRAGQFIVNFFVCAVAFSCPELTILLAYGRDRELWPDQIFSEYADYSFRILNQSYLSDFDGKSLNRGLPVLDQARSLPQARRIVGSGDENGFVMQINACTFVTQVHSDLLMS